jgi:16S rRNA (guanine966-N2)-methyltransferase
MRITGGAARGRSLRAPRGSRVRPTADKVRAAIFNILGSRTEIAGRNWLDLFCGTGAVGLEALSRGAARVVLVDGSPESCRMARENLERSGLADRAEVRRLPLPEGLRPLARAGIRFDGVFVDPPYRQGLADRTLVRLGDGDLLAADALVVVEYASDEVLAERYGSLRRTDARRYGTTGLALYSNGEET